MTSRMTSDADRERELIAEWLERRNLKWAADKIRALEHHGPKMTVAERNARIFERVLNGEKQKDVARDYGIKPSRIGPIWSKERKRQWQDGRRDDAFLRACGVCPAEWKRHAEPDPAVSASFSELWIVRCDLRETRG